MQTMVLEDWSANPIFMAQFVDKYAGLRLLQPTTAADTSSTHCSMLTRKTVAVRSKTCLQKKEGIRRGSAEDSTHTLGNIIGTLNLVDGLEQDFYFFIQFGIIIPIDTYFSDGLKPPLTNNHPLINTKKTIEHVRLYCGWFTHEKCSFSIVMLVYRRVTWNLSRDL